MGTVSQSVQPDAASKTAGQSARGRIVAIERYVGGPANARGAYYRPIIEYSVGGVQYRFAGATGTNRLNYDIGQEVEITVSPDKPENVRITADSLSRLGAKALGISGTGNQSAALAGAADDPFGDPERILFKTKEDVRAEAGRLAKVETGLAVFFLLVASALLWFGWNEWQSQQGRSSPDYFETAIYMGFGFIMLFGCGRTLLFSRLRRRSRQV